MTFTITIDMDNAAFMDQPGAECARILRRLAVDIQAAAGSGMFASPGGTLADLNNLDLRDINGNLVGAAHLTA